MKNEFKEGSIWKTRGGWKAVVVDTAGDGDILVYHTKTMYILGHDEHGVNSSELTDYDLISPWTEPRSGEFWVNVYNYHGDIIRIMTDKKAEKRDFDYKLLATKHIKWVEGDTE